ncbi:MAG TPA: septal ring lytic transglycosylase RlpA family protein [Nitrospirales bacterium]|nr:septal ring lytic transglycosylase RlpA family protein [Nitrospirales bacterium]
MRTLASALFFGLLLILPACGGPPSVRDLPAGYPIGHREQGVASWYGPGFHGNKTASGERFDMHEMTAAHRTLPFGSIVLVRSLTTGRQVKVRVNDRGPFARQRIMDLSHAAGRSLGMLGEGTDQVELTVVGFEGRAGAYGSLWVQAASFSELDHARALAARLKARYGDVRISPVDVSSGKRYRVQVGRFRDERQAQAVANELERKFSLDPLVIRDDA